jgi:hypothetical protein
MAMRRKRSRSNPSILCWTFCRTFSIAFVNLFSSVLLYDEERSRQKIIQRENEGEEKEQAREWGVAAK